MDHERLAYGDLPVLVLGSPGAARRFRRRRPMIDAWQVFPFLAAAVATLLAVGWLRRLISMMGPD